MWNPDSKLEKYILDYYKNENAEHKITVLYFHDSNMTIIDSGNYSPREYFSFHFENNYFYRGAFNMSIVDKIKPDIIIHELMERFLNTYRG
jgi:hypothetical protein